MKKWLFWGIDWLLLACTLMLFIVCVCGVDALRYGVLPYAQPWISLGGIFLLSIAMSYYSSHIIPRCVQWLTQETEFDQSFFYINTLIDLSLLWLFLAYCLLHNYRLEAPFWSEVILWAILMLYLILWMILRLISKGR